MFANPILHEFHVDFWYKNATSPLPHLDLDKPLWATTPLRLLATSATAVRIISLYLRVIDHRHLNHSINSWLVRFVVYRRAWNQGQSYITRTTEFSYNEGRYTEMEKKIISGMNRVLQLPPQAGTEAEEIRSGLQLTLLKLHQRGM